MATGEGPTSYCGKGQEFEPDQKDLNRIVEYHLEVFRKAVVRDLNYTTLLMVYDHFLPEQRQELFQMGRRTEANHGNIVLKGLEMIRGLDNQPDKYKDLLEALQGAGCEKICSILKGEIIPDNDRNRNHINSNLKYICENIIPSEIIPSLVSKGVINDEDCVKVRGLQINSSPLEGMLELIFLLPRKNQYWYPRFIEALLHVNADVAEKIDEDLCAELRKRSSSGEEDWSLMEKYVSCVPIQSNTSEDHGKSDQHHGKIMEISWNFVEEDTAFTRKFNKENLNNDVSNDVRTHVMEDFHEASLGANNLSAAEKPGVDESMTNMSLKFDEMLTNHDNVHQKPDNSLQNQSISMREPYSELSQGTSLHNNSQSDFKETEAELLTFQSLLSEPDTTCRTKNSKAQESGMVSGNTSSMPQQKLSSFTQELDDNSSARNSESIESYRPSTASSRSANGMSIDETALKTVSIESNDRVPINAGTKDQERALEIYSRTIRDNSHSPDLKFLHDKNVTTLNGNGAMNIQSDEPYVEPEAEEVEDIDITLRGYQQELAGPALQGKNVIIVAPTGSGKTRVALRIIQEHIRKQQGRGIAKVIFLVNQVALANQQGEECMKQLKRYKSKVISGETQRGRKEYLKDFIDKRDILIVTAQVLLDSLSRKEIEGINLFSLMVFDECHHTHANHTFNQIMAMYMNLKFSKKPPVLPQIVGLTASVGVGKARNEEKAVEHIKKLMANLDAQMICTVQNNMQELRSFVALPDEETFTVSKRENDIFGESVIKLMSTIEKMMTISSVVKEMEEAQQFEKVLKPPAAKGSAQYTQWVCKLWKETAKLRSHEARRFLNPCRTHLEHYNNALIIHNDARVQDALSYLDREMKKWRDQAKGHMDATEEKLDKAFKKLRNYKFDQCSDNPKLEKLREMIVKAYTRDWENSRGIVFVRTRELAKAVISWMKETPRLRDLNPIQFLGQNPHADKGGMTKAEQDDVLNYFKDGKHKLIVATSVAEEGLDISKCNLVIRYDHVTNEIAMVQSRGRGRAKDSKYYVIAEEGTGMAEKEELNMIREIMMRRAIIKLQEEIQSNPVKFQKDLHDLQDEANLDHQLKSLGSKRRLPRVGDFELQCQKCSKFICMSQDIKRIREAHHVIVDETLTDRVDFVKNETEEPAVETNQPIGKLSCKGCGENLGVIVIHRNLEFPVPKIEKFLIVDNNGRHCTGKKWKDLPLVVSDLSNNDFKNIIATRRQNGDLHD